MTAPDDPWGPVPDVDPLDELASALLDGEATDEERARAEEPGVAARVAAFEAVARRVAEPVAPPSDADRDAAIRTALGAVVPGVPSLDAARERRVARRRAFPAWLPGVAAAIAVIAGLGLLFASLPAGDDDEQSTSEGATMETQAETSGAAEDSATFDAGDEGAEESGEAATESAAAAAFDAGVHPDVESLVTALRERASIPAGGSGAGVDDTAEEGATRNGAAELQRCTAPGADEVVTAVVDGTEVVVGITFDEATGVRRYQVIQVADCQLLESGEL